ncbi:MAG: portal protein [Inquilinaceae bacterium]
MDTADIIARFEALKGERTPWHALWQEVADYVLPRRGDFSVRRSPGQRRTERLFDGTATWANEQLAAGLHGLLTTPAVRWFSLRVRDERLDRAEPVRLWLDHAAERMAQVFNAPQANFNPQAHELYLDLGAFGSAVMFVGDRPGQGIRFQTRHLGECHIAESDTGAVDTLYREFMLTARQAVQMFGAATPEPVARLADTAPHTKSTYLHAVFPRAEAGKGGAPINRNKPWASHYLSLDHKTPISESGFDEFPYLVPRWSKVTGETYGRSPAMTVLPDIKMLNAMKKTVIVAAQKAVDPPLMVPDDGFLNPIRTVPGGLNYYRSGGRDRIEPLIGGGRIDIGMEMVAAQQQAIVRAFYADWLSLRDGPQMTATEVLQRREERMRLLGPMMSRLQTEFLGPLIERTFKIMLRARAFDPPPEDLADVEIEVDYVSPIAQAQKATRTESLGRVLDVAERLAQYDPALLDLVDGEAALREIATVYNAPPRLLRSEEEIAARREAEAEREALQAEAAEAMTARASPPAQAVPSGGGAPADGLAGLLAGALS